MTAIPPHRWVRLLLGIVAVPLIALAALSSFAWPAARMAPRHLPIAVAGPAQSVAPLVTTLGKDPGAYDVHVYGGAAPARRAVENRVVYAALVPSPRGLTVLTASAASPVVAQQVTTAAMTFAAASAQPPPHVVDVVAADPHDPRQAAFGSIVLPLVLSGVLGGLIVGSLAVRRAGRVGALLAVSALAAVAATAVVQSWLGVVHGAWWADAGVLGLAVLAVSSLVVGLGLLLGNPGRAVAGASMVFIGNPFSAASSAPELLPWPVGDLGSLLPPGAAVQLLRSSAFFHGNGAARPLTVLIVWTVLGLALLTAAGRHTPTRDTEPDHGAPHPGPGRAGLHVLP